MYDKSVVDDSLKASYEIKEFFRLCDERTKNVCRISENNGNKDKSEENKIFMDISEIIQQFGKEHPWDEVVEELSYVEEKSDIVLNTNVSEIVNPISVKKNFKLRLIKNAIMFVMCLAIAFGLATFITAYVAHQTTVEGESMEPALYNDDSIIIQKVSYYLNEPKRYDVVVFPVSIQSDSDDVYYIKRIIGLPGERIQIKEGHVYINGAKLEDDCYSEEDIEDPGIASEPILIGDDEYFVLGDNRNMSTDSRYRLVGMVKREDIAGEAWWCIWPFSHINRV